MRDAADLRQKKIYQLTKPIIRLLVAKDYPRVDPLTEDYPSPKYLLICSHFIVSDSYKNPKPPKFQCRVSVSVFFIIMITAILRRASYTLSKRVISAAIISAANSTAVGQLHQLSALTNRPFHSKTEPLLFRASLPSYAGFAVADFPYEESTKANSDEGLEIAKLGISDEIVSSLAKKGITKLFPIQVSFLGFYHFFVYEN